MLAPLHQGQSHANMLDRGHCCTPDQEYASYVHILDCCLAFGWALTVAVVPFSHPHEINEGQVSGCIAAEREAGPLVGPYSSRTLPESTLLQLTWFPNLCQAKGG